MKRKGWRKEASSFLKYQWRNSPDSRRFWPLNFTSALELLHPTFTLPNLTSTHSPVLLCITQPVISSLHRSMQWHGLIQRSERHNHCFSSPPQPPRHQSRRRLSKDVRPSLRSILRSGVCLVRLLLRQTHQTNRFPLLAVEGKNELFGEERLVSLRMMDICAAQCHDKAGSKGTPDDGEEA